MRNLELKSAMKKKRESCCLARNKVIEGKTIVIEEKSKEKRISRIKGQILQTLNLCYLRNLW